jgi:glycosyltransferase involved in cell wall biosynthesis
MDDGEKRPQLSIIMPTLNEEKLIEHTLRTLKEMAAGIEIIVVDGESDDTTVKRASGSTRVITAPRGRGKQLNAKVDNSPKRLEQEIHGVRVGPFRTFRAQQFKQLAQDDDWRPLKKGFLPTWPLYEKRSPPIRFLSSLSSASPY